MKKDEWEGWCSTVWEHSITSNVLIKVTYRGRLGVKTNIGRILAATQEHLIIQLFGVPFGIHYKRLRSIEKIEKNVSDRGN